MLLCLRFHMADFLSDPVSYPKQSVITARSAVRGAHASGRAIMAQLTRDSPSVAHKENPASKASQRRRTGLSS